MKNNITKKSSNNFYITTLILLCTSLIILTNYISSQNTAKKIHEQIMQIEYNKIWWKDNYDILRELQKKEILIYLETIKEEKPELIQEIKNKIKASKNNYNFLDNQTINNLKKDTYIKWNTWALISIIEFSDLECEYCINFHKSNILNDVLNKYPKNTNYIFKNFPLPTYKNSKIEAKYAICIKNLSNWEKYLNFINKIYNTTNWWWEWIEFSKLNEFAIDLWIEEEKFQNCLKNETYKEEVEKEFEQWRSLEIDSVPSIVILNNNSWEYILIKWLIELETIIEKIEELNK